MIRIRIFILVLLVLLVTPQLSYSQYSLTKQQGNALLTNGASLVMKSEKLINIAADLQTIYKTVMDAGQDQDYKAIGEEYLTVLQEKIAETGFKLDYEAEATMLFCLIDQKISAHESNDIKSELMKIRKHNLDRLIVRTKQNLKTIQIVYGMTDKNSVLKLYDQAKEIIRSVLSTLDENIRILESVKAD